MSRHIPNWILPAAEPEPTPLLESEVPWEAIREGEEAARLVSDYHFAKRDRIIAKLKRDGVEIEYVSELFGMAAGSIYKITGKAGWHRRGKGKGRR